VPEETKNFGELRKVSIFFDVVNFLLILILL